MENPSTDASSSETPPPAAAPVHDRWPFIRDVLVLQLKLVLSNIQNFLMLPVSIAAAIYGLVVKPRERQGEHFYKVLEISREVDEAINIYGAIGGYHATGPSPEAVCLEEAKASAASPDGGASWRGTTVDGVVRRVEDVIVGEIRKGGTVANVKAAVDKLLDDIQRNER